MSFSAPSEGLQLRVSLTQACAFRCPYCQPGGPVAAHPRSEMLSVAEIQRVVRHLANPEMFGGVRGVRFTGGEPLQRAECEDAVAAVAEIEGIEDIALTTNAEHLGARAQLLRNAGLTRINIHLDSLKEERFAELSGGKDLYTVLEAIAATKEAGLIPLKVNCVVMKGINDDEIIEFCEFAKRWELTVRFIELMNTGSAQAFFEKHFVAAGEIRERVAARYEIAPTEEPRGAMPAEEFRLVGTGAGVGFIASESEPFCRACNRLRLSADGRISRCLYEAGGIPLRELLRDENVNDEQLRDVLLGAIAGKRSHHPSFGKPGEKPFAMAEIGG